MATLAINPETETAVPLPYDLANVPDGYWDRATNPTGSATSRRMVRGICSPSPRP